MQINPLQSRKFDTIGRRLKRRFYTADELINFIDVNRFWKMKYYSYVLILKLRNFQKVPINFNLQNSIYFFANSNHQLVVLLAAKFSGNFFSIEQYNSSYSEPS